MRFTDFPPEVLREISLHVSGLEIALLWFCGTKSVQNKLVGVGGISKFSISSFELGKLQWPYLVRRFKSLSDFTMIDRYSNDKFRITTFMLQRVPDTLRKMVLELRGCISAFHLAMDMDSRRFPNLRELRLVEHSEQMPIETLGNVQWPIFLETLQVSCFRSVRLPLELSMLPQSLTYLDGNFCAINGWQKAVFPRNLLHLKLGVQLSQDEELLPIYTHIETLLPQGLLSLELHFTRGYSDIHPVSNLSRLPPALETLGMTWKFTQNLEKTYHEYLLMLPTSLKTLLVSVLAFEDLKLKLLPYLPPNLTNAGMLTPGNITKEMARMLPRGLERLNSARVDLDAIPHLPPNCDSLVPGPGNFSLLINELESMQLKTIPINLKRVILYSADFPLHLLPPSVHTIYLYVKWRNEPIHMRDDADEEEEEEEEEIQATEKKVTPDTIQNLPRQLKFLDLKTDVPICHTEEDVYSVFLSLPPNLSYLQMSLPEPLPGDSSVFLPKYLRELRFRVNSGQSIPKDWFLGLPGTIEVLWLGGGGLDGSQHDWSIALPENLVLLHIEFKKIPHGGYRKLLASIPRKSWRVTEIRIHDTMCLDSGLTNKDLTSLLPPRLRTLQVPVSDKLTEECIPKLPKTMTVLNVAKHAPKWWVSHRNKDFRL